MKHFAFFRAAHVKFKDFFVPFFFFHTYGAPGNNLRAPNSSIYQKILENEHNGENQCDFKTYFSKMCCTMI